MLVRVSAFGPDYVGFHVTITENYSMETWSLMKSLFTRSTLLAYSQAFCSLSHPMPSEKFNMAIILIVSNNLLCTFSLSKPHLTLPFQFQFPILLPRLLPSLDDYLFAFLFHGGREQPIRPATLDLLGALFRLTPELVSRITPTDIHRCYSAVRRVCLRLS
jgi:hypothetical protein